MRKEARRLNDRNHGDSSFVLTTTQDGWQLTDQFVREGDVSFWIQVPVVPRVGQRARGSILYIPEVGEEFRHCTGAKIWFHGVSRPLYG